MEGENDLKKVWFVTFLCMICMSSLTGCWDRVEIKDLALVVGSGIDKGSDGKLRGTVEIAVPPAIGGASSGANVPGRGKSYVLVTEDGRNVKSMIQKMQERVPRRLYFAHRSVVIIGEAQAREGLHNILDHFARDPMNRLRTLIVVTEGTTAEKILKTPTILEKVPGQEIKEIEHEQIGTVTTMQDFFMAASSEGITPTAPAIGIVDGEDDQPGTQKLVMFGTAVFKNLKLVGYLTANETRGLMWVTGKIQHAFITAEIPNNPGTVVMTLVSAKREFQPIFKGNQIEFNVKLKGKGEIDENSTNLNIGDVKNFKVVKQAFDKAVKRYIQKSFDKAQKLDADVFGFGQEIAHTNPRQWDKIRDHWDEMFKHARLNLEVDIQPTRAGRVGPPLHLKEDEVKQTS
jgi:spore germination protein KC